MSVSRALLWHELRMLRAPFLVLTLIHLLVVLTLAEWRDGNTHPPQLLYLPIAFAVAIVVDRVFLARRRGTWLLLPISRARQVNLKLGVYALLLVVHTLAGAITYYAMIWASDAPGQPLPYFAELVSDQVAWQLASAFEVLALGWVASIQEKKWVGAFWVGSAAALEVGLEQLTYGFTFASMDIPLDVGARHTLAAILMAVVGWVLVQQETRSVGRAASVPQLGLRALGLTPLCTYVLLGAIIPFTLVNKMSQPSARSHDEIKMLTDGEIVLLHVEENIGMTGHRNNGETLFFPFSDRTPNAGPIQWSTSSGSYSSYEEKGDAAYISRDRRQVLFFDHRRYTPRFGRQIGCWGSDGVAQSLDCTPFPEDIIAVGTKYSLRFPDPPEPLGERTTTSERVVDRDLRGETHELFRGHGVLSTVVLNRDQSVIFTSEQTYLVGAVARSCPAIPPNAAALLTDGTLAVIHEEQIPFDSFLDRIESRFVTFDPHTKESVVFCGPDGAVREEPWPRPPTYRPYPRESYIHVLPKTSVMFPFPSSTMGSDRYPWMVVPILALRVLGFLAMSLAWKKRGLLLALPGLILGPAYFLAAAFVLGDFPAFVERMWRRRANKGNSLTNAA